MTDQEWQRVVAVITANWPHSLPPDSALTKWRSDLADLPATQVLAAVEALARDGREFPPNGAIIRKRAVELMLDLPDAAHAFELVHSAAGRFGADRWPEARAWLDDHSPAVTVAAARFGWREFCRFEGEQSHLRAQFRDTYRGVAQRVEREAVYAGIPTAGLRALERGKPRRLGEVVKELAP